MATKTLTFKQMVAEAEAKIKAAYDFDAWVKVIQDIENIINELNGVGKSAKPFKAYTADELSRIGGRLAILRSSLIEQMQESERMVVISKAYIHVRRASIRPTVKSAMTRATKKDSKPPTASDIEAEVDRQMAETQLIHDLHKVHLEMLNKHWYGIPEVLHRIETRIRLLTGDKNTAGQYDDSEHTPLEINDDEEDTLENAKEVFNIKEKQN